MEETVTQNPLIAFVGLIIVICSFFCMHHLNVLEKTPSKEYAPDAYEECKQALSEGRHYEYDSGITEESLVYWIFFAILPMLFGGLLMYKHSESGRVLINITLTVFGVVLALCMMGSGSKE